MSQGRWSPGLGTAATSREDRLSRPSHRPRVGETEALAAPPPSANVDTEAATQVRGLLCCFVNCLQLKNLNLFLFKLSCFPINFLKGIRFQLFLWDTSRGFETYCSHCFLVYK